MREIIENLSMYENSELRKFISELETRYVIEDAQSQYHRLVNFSANAVVPYHKWFKYREGFAAELIQELIKMSGASAEEVIVDPFCGSGTTNVVAAFEGFHTLGLDVNPMSAFLTQAKITSYTTEEVTMAENLADQITRNMPPVSQAHYEEIRKYFNEANFNDLLRIRNYIKALDDDKSKQLLFVAFVSIIEECSDRKRDGNGLKTVPTKVCDALAFFKQKVHDIAEDIKSNQLTTGIQGYGVYDSAFNLAAQMQQKFTKHKTGAIIFSPPYANSFDYFESYKLELIFADFAIGMKGISQLRKKAVRSFIGAEKQSECDQYVDILAQEIEAAIPLKEKETGKKDSRTRKVPNMLRGYFADMYAVIQQCSEILEAGKMTYIVVDQSAYLGKIVPTDLLLAHYAESVGFEVSRIIECRKARTSTQQLNKYPYLKSALRESIVCLKKK